jgi:hypothetical protein
MSGQREKEFYYSVQIDDCGRLVADAQLQFFVSGHFALNKKNTTQQLLDNRSGTNSIVLGRN